MIPRPGNNTLYSNDLYTDKMIEYIKNSTTDGKPFFGYLAFQVAHSPFQSPQATVQKYDKIYQAGWDEIIKQSFENQKKLGFWNADMKLPDRISPDVPWTDLTPEQQAYASRILAVRAAMIENMDHDVGRVIQLLKDKGQYENTLIVFVSYNGSSEPAPLLNIKFSSANEDAVQGYLKIVNNSLSNLGNVSSIINYAAWGPAVGTSPLSGFKATEYEGGTRVPGSIALIAFYISTRTINIASVGIQDDVGAIDILSKILQAAIAGISIYILRSSTVIWRSATTRAQPSSKEHMLYSYDQSVTECSQFYIHTSL